MRLPDLAALLDAELVLPDGVDADAIELSGVAPIQNAGPHELTFLVRSEYVRFLAQARAGAVLLGKPSEGCGVPQLVHPNPYWAFAKASQAFFVPRAPRPGIDAGAFVAEDVQVGADVTIHRFAYVDRGAKLGDRVVLYPGVYVGEQVEIGADTVVHANVSLEAETVVGERVLIHAGAVLGGDGFGFAPGAEGLAKIVQSGRVTIGDDVEIGANTSIDRGAMADTSIGSGTKIDSHVQIGHNVVVGRHSMICGMAGLAGSARLGDRVIIAGHSVVNNHVEIADDVQIAGFSGVRKSLTEPGQYAGIPAVPIGEWRRNLAREHRLPKLEQRVRELERKLSELEQRTGD